MWSKPNVDLAHNLFNHKPKKKCQIFQQYNNEELYFCEQFTKHRHTSVIIAFDDSYM